MLKSNLLLYGNVVKQSEINVHFCLVEILEFAELLFDRLPRS